MGSEQKLLSFKDWMARNNRAYYARKAPGKSGDFITSPVVHRAFGEAIGRQLLEMDEQMGHPDPFFLMEFGGGNGQLAFDVLAGIREESPTFFSRLSYGISDFPEPLEMFRGRFEAEFPDLTDRLSFFPSFGFDFFSRLGTPAFQGCVLANEFLDALPIHLVVKRGLEFKEVFISESDDSFDVVELQPTPEVKTFIDAYHPDLPDGSFAEINLDMQTWVRGVSSSLKRGFALIIDYGGKEGERPSGGTLRGFKNHKMVEVNTLNLGDGDWTSDIDFSILARVAQREGFSVTGFSTQGNFLLGLGMADRLPTFKKRELSLVDLKEHLAMKFLFHPEGMGNAFHVLGLHKGVTPSKLAGFSIRQETL